MRVTSVLANEDVVNETNAIYFRNNNVFELLRFELEGDLKSTIKKAFDYILAKQARFAKMVIIPFSVYAEHELEKTTEIPFTMFCEDMGVEAIIPMPKSYVEFQQCSNIDEEI